MGAMTFMNRRPRRPVLGSIGAGAVAVGAHMTDAQLLFALADFGFMINLLTMLPLGSMDGGLLAGCDRYIAFVKLQLERGITS
jgi:Zn-dependent protease